MAAGSSEGGTSKSNSFRGVCQPAARVNAWRRPAVGAAKRTGARDPNEHAASATLALILSLDETTTK